MGCTKNGSEEISAKITSQLKSAYNVSVSTPKAFKIDFLTTPSETSVFLFFEMPIPSENTASFTCFSVVFAMPIRSRIAVTTPLR